MPSPQAPPGGLPSPGLYPGNVGGFTDGVEASLASWQDPAGNWYAYNQALAQMFEQVYGLVSDQGDPDSPATYTPGWSVLLDPVNCPTQFLPYLAMFVGSFIPAGTDDATARAIITSESGFARGTPAAIVAAAKRWLGGTRSCVLCERLSGDGNTADPYSFVVVCRPEEVLDANALKAAVDAIRPAGVRWTLILADGTTWNEAVHTWQQQTATWNQAAAIDP